MSSDLAKARSVLRIVLDALWNGIITEILGSADSTRGFMTKYPCCTIGIPAYNEEFTLPLLLNDLYVQLQDFRDEVQIIVVANGCIDKTTELAVKFGVDHFGNPVFAPLENQNWWDFTQTGYLYQVCETQEAKKSNALNIIHKKALSDIVILFDSDVRLGTQVIYTMMKSMSETPSIGVVAVRYIGEIAPLKSKYDPLERIRILLSQVINDYDKYIPRLDGRGCGYRKKLIAEHPSLIAVDMWLEGMAWEKTEGCIYLDNVHVLYQFPASFHEFTLQYSRYVTSIRALTAKYPSLVKSIQRGRKSARNKINPYPTFYQRLFGWLFYRWIDLYGLFQRDKNTASEKWQVIYSTKTFSCNRRE